MLLQLNKITVPPGSQLLLHDITWDDFRHILDELGERRSARLSYSKGTLEIMTPLPEHETGKKIIGDLVSALLDELQQFSIASDTSCFVVCRAPHGTQQNNWVLFKRKAL